MKYRFSGNEVVMKYFGNGVLLLPINDLPRYQYLHLHHQCQASSYTGIVQELTTRMRRTGGGNTGFWPLQLTIPASIAFCSGCGEEGASGRFTAVMRAIGLRCEVTSTTSSA
jgi:hypothetical protein